MLSHNAVTIPRHPALDARRQRAAGQTREWYRTRDEQRRAKSPTKAR